MIFVAEIAIFATKIVYFYPIFASIRIVTGTLPAALPRASIPIGLTWHRMARCTQVQFGESIWMRYERMESEYFVSGVRRDEQCRTYDDFFPVSFCFYVSQESANIIQLCQAHCMPGILATEQRHHLREPPESADV